MYDINKLRRELADSPKQLALLNLIHHQVATHATTKRLTITIPKKEFSSNLKKKILHMMGYEVPYRKITNDEVYIVKID